jgi:hypothetical protein
MSQTVLRIKQFLTQAQCNELNVWVGEAVKYKWLDCGVSRGSRWEYEDRLTTRAYGYRFEYPKIVHNVFEQITEFLGLHNLEKSEVGGGRDGVVVSCTFVDGDVYEHIDPMEGSKHVLRCNLMTQKANGGAKLYVNGEHIDIEVGELHCYLPSNVPHYVTKVEGQTPRILWMFGYKCDKERFNQLLNTKIKQLEPV